MSFKSWSYLPVNNWWMRPFSFFNKKQEVDIKEQYNRFKVRGFDLTVRFNNKNQLLLCNNKIDYKYDSEQLLNDLSWIDSRTDCYVRVTLEDNKNKDRFIEFCKMLESNFKYIKFFGGCDYYNEHIYYFEHFPNYIESNFTTKSSSKSHNSILKSTFKDKDILILSFVNYV